MWCVGIDSAVGWWNFCRELWPSPSGRLGVSSSPRCRWEHFGQALCLRRSPSCQTHCPKNTRMRYARLFWLGLSFQDNPVWPTRRGLVRHLNTIHPKLAQILYFLQILVNEVWSKQSHGLTASRAWILQSEQSSRKLCLPRCGHPRDKDHRMPGPLLPWRPLRSPFGEVLEHRTNEQPSEKAPLQLFQVFSS